MGSSYAHSDGYAEDQRNQMSDTDRAVDAYIKMREALDTCMNAEKNLQIALRMPGVDLTEYSRRILEMRREPTQR